MAALHQSDPNLFSRFMDYIGVIARDEVHLSLGPSTTEALRAGISLDIGSFISRGAEILANDASAVHGRLEPLFATNGKALKGRGVQLVDALGAVVATVDETNRQLRTVSAAQRANRDKVTGALVTMVQAMGNHLGGEGSLALFADNAFDGLDPTVEQLREALPSSARFPWIFETLNINKSFW
jgi:hypothetical protein